MNSRNSGEKSIKSPAEETIELGKELVKAGEETVLAASKLPVAAVKTTVEVEKQGAKVITNSRPVRSIKNFWYGLGPGLTTGASDDDPSGIATYSQTGAKYGFQLLWLSLFTFPLMAVVQEMCARIGLQTGRGLAYNIRKHFPKWVLYLTAFLVFIANSFNIGADLGALAQATQLVWPAAPYVVLVLFFTLFSLGLEIFFSYDKYAKYLKYLAVLLSVYVFTAFVIKDFPWPDVLQGGLVPSMLFTKEQIILVAGIFGTTISPYLFFWQTSQEVEERIAGGKTVTELVKEDATKKDINKMRLDVWVGMFFSNLAMFFIIAVCGATLFPNGINNITTASEAASALKPLAGNYASLLFALGILGVGLLGVPVLAGSAAYAVSESFGWHEGLNKKFSQAKAFYATIIFSMLIGFSLNFIGIDPIKALIYSAVANGLVAPIVLVLIVLLSSKKSIMGVWVNSRLTSFIGWVAAIVMIVVGIAAIYSFF